MAQLTVLLRDLQKQRDRLQHQIGRLDTAISILRSLNVKSRRGGKRKLSPAARERIAAAQRVRWAKWKKANKAA